MARYCTQVPGPKLANCLENGLSPMLPPQKLAELGFTIAAYPLSLLAVRDDACSYEVERQYQANKCGRSTVLFLLLHCHCWSA